MERSTNPLIRALEEIEKERAATSFPSAIPLDETHLFCKDQKFLNFSSPDALGLSFHTALQKNAMKFALQHGHGSTHAPGCLAMMSVHAALLQKLEETLVLDSALLFPTRLSAHMAAITAIANSQSLILLDHAAHFSLKHAAICSSAQVETFAHGDIHHLKRLLEETKNLAYFTKVIVTESLSANLGDISPLDELSELAAHYDATLYVDDTLAIGVMGKRGLGLTLHKKGIGVRVAAFDHGCGGSLAFVGGSHLILRYIRAVCPALRENPLPLPSLGVVDALLDLLPDLEGERKQLQQKAYFLHSRLQQLKLSVAEESTHLIPLFFKENAEALQAHEKLLEAHIVADLMLSPVAVSSRPRLMLSVSTHHTPEQLCKLLDVLSDHALQEALV